MSKLLTLFFLIILISCNQKKSDAPIVIKNGGEREIVAKYKNGQIYCAGKYGKIIIRDNQSDEPEEVEFETNIGNWNYYTPEGIKYLEMEFDNLGFLKKRIEFGTNGRKIYESNWTYVNGKVEEFDTLGNLVKLEEYKFEVDDIEIENDGSPKILTETKFTTSFFSNGDIKEKYTEINDLMDGDLMEFDSIGKLILFVKYKNGIIENYSPIK